MFIDGEVITEQTILPKIHGKVKATAAELVEAMDGKLSFEDRFLLQSLEHYSFGKSSRRNYSCNQAICFGEI